MRIEIEAGNLARPQCRIVLGDGKRGAQADRRCERAAPAGAMLDSLRASPYVPASRWHSTTWSANTRTDRADRPKT
jgi:hypothetical protein